MSPLETILTLAVWVVVAVVFFYYRSQAVKHLREQNRSGKQQPPASGVKR